MRQMHEPLSAEERALKFSVCTDTDLDIAALCARWHGQHGSTTNKQRI